MDQDLAARISVFFLDPAVEPTDIRPENPPTVKSVLYLLRRDIRGAASQHVYIFAIGMMTLAGIDLVAKFHAGDDGVKDGKVGKRFQEFVNTYFDTADPRDPKVIWQLRNALLHSFGLYTEKVNFSLQDLHHHQLVVRGPTLSDGTEQLSVSVFSLYEYFEEALARYHQALLADAQLQANFAAMFDRYGYISIGIISPPV